MPYKCKFFGGLGMGDEPVDACRNPDAHEWVCPYAKTWTFHKCEYRWMPTNADRIRAMSDEELADEILSWFNWLNAVEWDDKRIIEWLKQETQDANDNN